MAFADKADLPGRHQAIDLDAGTLGHDGHQRVGGGDHGAGRMDLEALAAAGVASETLRKAMLSAPDIVTTLTIARRTQYNQKV